MFSLLSLRQTAPLRALCAFPRQQQRHLTGFVRIKQGERAALWDREGKLSVIDGPYSSFVVQKEVEFLQKYAASPKQFIFVEFKDGRVEHWEGPCSIFRDPLEHKNVVVMEGIELGARQGIAVWNVEKKIVFLKNKSHDLKKEAERNVTLIFGPCIHLPKPNEVHTKIVCNYANSNQFLKVHYLNGSVKHIRGPVEMWTNPNEHMSIKLEECVTVDPGCAVEIYRAHPDRPDKKKESTRLVGPLTYMPQPFETVIKLNGFTAGDLEYIRIVYSDGRIEHKPGPSLVWQDPDTMKTVTVQPAIQIESHEAVVLYSFRSAPSSATTQSAPSATSAQSAPSATSAQSAPSATSAQSAPSATSVKSAPSATSVKSAPSATSAQSAPSATSAQSAPSVTPAQSAPSAISTQSAESLSPEKLRELSDQGNVTRRIAYGPMILVPLPTEWVHTFQWHGSDLEERKKGKVTGRKIPGGLNFRKLRLVPDQFYFDAEGVRTADDAQLTMKFMMYYELSDVERMLQQTHDPIAELINALTADAIGFTNVRPFELFKADTELLGKLETYQQTLARAERIGYTISKIVYRGYHSSEKLQHMHDEAIEARTKLKLDSETEYQALELQDIKIKRKQERERVEQQIEVENMKHQVWKSQQKIDQTLKEDEAIHMLKLKQEKENHTESISYLSQLGALGVNLTHYLTAKYQHPDKLLKIENVRTGKNREEEVSGDQPPPHFHLKL